MCEVYLQYLVHRQPSITGNYLFSLKITKNALKIQSIKIKLTLPKAKYLPSLRQFEWNFQHR